MNLTSTDTSKEVFRAKSFPLSQRYDTAFFPLDGKCDDCGERIPARTQCYRRIGIFNHVRNPLVCASCRGLPR